MIAPFAKAPEAILPIGQTLYESRVTSREEWLPASIGVVGARGSDASLLTFLGELMEHTELQTSVQVGRTAFPTSCSSGMEDLVVSS